jgi:hypothetical protein
VKNFSCLVGPLQSSFDRSRALKAVTIMFTLSWGTTHEDPVYNQETAPTSCYPRMFLPNSTVPPAESNRLKGSHYPTTFNSPREECGYIKTFEFLYQTTGRHILEHGILCSWARESQIPQCPRSYWRKFWINTSAVLFAVRAVWIIQSVYYMSEVTSYLAWQPRGRKVPCVHVRFYHQHRNTANTLKTGSSKNITVFCYVKPCGSCTNRSLRNVATPSSEWKEYASSQLLVTANVVPNKLILFILLMEAIIFSDMPVLIKPIRCHIPEDGIHRSHRLENLKAYSDGIMVYVAISVHETYCRRDLKCRIQICPCNRVSATPICDRSVKLSLNYWSISAEAYK